MKDLVLEINKDTPTVSAMVEMVERKGVGHPDYICDAVMERISQALSRAYIDRFGRVLHHNIDKGLLIAGQVEKHFGGGMVTRPMEFIVGDRATFVAGKTNIPVADIATDAAISWFKENLRQIDPYKDLKIRIALQPGSVSLADIFSRKGAVMGANDTSAAVGYAPLTPTEKAVLDLERHMNSSAFKQEFPMTGEDVKVMGVRIGRAIDLTVACPLMAGLIESEAEYFRRKREVLTAINDWFTTPYYKKSFNNIAVSLNTLDVKGHGMNGVYLTLLGTSAEDADSGQVGRGNRVNGVISLNRPMGTEAAAGKNPVSHVGKIYSVLSHVMANEIYSNIDNVKEVYVWLVSRIGQGIDRPKCAHVRLITGRGIDKRTAGKRVSAIVDGFFSNIKAFTDELAMGVHPVC